MPKRAREGVWAVEVSESDDSAAMEEAVAAAPLAAAGGSGGGGGGAAVRCPFQACMRCAWGVPPEHHKNPVFIYDTYKRKMKSLEDETELTAKEKCEQSQLVNWQLMAMERNLFDDGDIKENDALMPLTFLRNDASSAGVWGMISVHGLAPVQPAGSRAPGCGEANAAAADTGDDGAADAAGGGKKNKKKKRMTLASMEAWTRDQWVEWDRDNARYEWSYDYEYDVKVKTDEGDAMLSYPEPAKQTLIDAYFSGLHRVEFSMTITHGRHQGSVHDYVVYWIDANEGFQFNPQNATAAVRKVVLTRTPWAVEEPQRWWNPESGRWEECRGWSW
jgi:hypothetical protein